MTTLKELTAFIELKGFVSPQMIADEFDVDLVKACDIVKACWDRGLLLPVNRAFFAIPSDDGAPPMWDMAADSSRKQLWYRPEIDAIRKLFAEDPTLAVTVNDMAKLMEVHPNRARKVLYLMAESGELIQEQAEAGGAYHKPPFIFALSKDHIRTREKQAIAESVARKKKGGAKRKANDKVRKTEANIDPRTKPISPAKPGKPLKVDFEKEY